MGGKGGSSGPSQADINQQAYAAGQSGAKWVDIQGQIPYGHDSALQSWMQGGAARQQQPHFAGFEFPEMAMPHTPESSGPSYEEQLAEQERMQREAEARQARIAGENDRDSLYSAYMDAASTATDYINSEIDREQSNAKLLGIDYVMDDEMKSQRISDYFATVWGEGEQSRLEALMGKWGNPQGFGGFTVTRGDASKYASQEGEETEVGQSRGQKPKPTLVTDEEEDTLGGNATILGA